MMRPSKFTYVVAGFLATCTTASVYAQGGLTCAAAVPVVDGNNAYNNAGATQDLDHTGLCDPGPFGTDINYNVVWFTWTAPATDTYIMSNCNTAGNVDTKLSAHTDCSAASVFACNDDGAGCANFSSIMTFSATAGTTYKLAVGVYSATTTGGPGTFTISVGGGGGGGGGDCCVANPGTVCCSDQACCDTVCAADPYCCATEWDQICANQAATMCAQCGGGGGGGCGSGGDCCVANPGTVGCADMECCNTVCASDPYCCETEWDLICANGAATLCTACGAGGCTIPPGAQAELEYCGEDTNGGCNGGGANEPTSLNNTIGGTFWASTAMRDTDWYAFTTTEGSIITMSLFSNLPCFCAVVDQAACTIVGAVSVGSCPSSTTSLCVGPGNYYIVALPSQFIDLPCGGPLGNDYTLELSSVTCEFVPPAGDDCGKPVVATIGANPFDNTTAGTSFGEVTCGFGGAPITKDVFFSFVAPATDGYTLQTCDSSAPFDTGVEVWEGCPDAGGVMIACNDDGPGCVNFSSFLAADLVGGTSYIIRVGGWNGAVGATELNITQGAPVGPPNDDCADAEVAMVGSTPFDTNGSSTDGPNPTDPSCGTFGAGFYNDVWFTFDAAATTTYHMSMCDAGFDTRIDIYDGCGGALVACNDDSCGLASEVDLVAAAGATYTIRIGGYGAGSFGTGTLVIADAGGGGGGGEGLTCATPVELAMGDTAFDRAGATVDLNFAGLCDMGPFGTDFNYNCIFYTFTPTLGGMHTFSTCNLATHDTRLSAQTTCDVSTVVGCNDDGAGCAAYTSIMTVQLECGVEYIIALGGYSATTPLGTGTLNVSVSNPVTCGPICNGDYDNDGDRDGADMSYLLSAWGTPGGDITGDGATNGFDLTMLLSGWGLCP